MTVENTPAAWTERAEIEDPHEAVGWSEAGQRERFASAMVCVGALNLPGSKLETWATLRRLWDKTSRVLAVSLYAGLDDRCLIYTDDEVEAFARSESYYSFVDRHRYNDLLMVLRK
jgi:hypothetical protein